MGAVLSQHFSDGDHPIAYFSKKLNSAQQKYTATEKEALAVVLAVNISAYTCLEDLSRLLLITRL